MRYPGTKCLLAVVIVGLGMVGCTTGDDRESRSERRNRAARASENFSDRDGDGIRDGLEDRNRNGIRDGKENGGPNRRDPDKYR
jgi:hypothetical protein